MSDGWVDYVYHGNLGAPIRCRGTDDIYDDCAGGIVNNTLRPEVPTWCDPTWKLLMERCWASEPVERPGFSEIASDLRTMAVATHPKAQGQFHIPSPETSSR